MMSLNAWRACIRARSGRENAHKVTLVSTSPSGITALRILFHAREIPEFEPPPARLTRSPPPYCAFRTIFCAETTSSCCFWRLDLTARIACRFLYWTICKVISAFQPSSCGHLKSISLPSDMTTVKYMYLPFLSTQSTVFMLAKWSSFALQPVSWWCCCWCWWSWCCLGGWSISPSSVSTQRFFFHSCSSPSLRFSSTPSFSTLTPDSGIATEPAHGRRSRIEPLCEELGRVTDDASVPGGRCEDSEERDWSRRGVSHTRAPPTGWLKRARWTRQHQHARWTSPAASQTPKRSLHRQQVIIDVVHDIQCNATWTLEIKQYYQIMLKLLNT